MPTKTLGTKLTLLLYAYFFVFIAAYVADAQIANFLRSAKWIPLIALSLYLITSLVKGYIQPPDRTATVLYLLILIAAIISSLQSTYREASFGQIAALAMLLICALLLATLIQSRRAEQDFFEILLNVGKVAISISFTMALLGINLGRGNVRFSGWSDNPNSLGLIIAPSIIVLFARVFGQSRNWKLRYLPYLMAGTFVLFLTSSRASIGWVFVSVLMFAVSKLNSGVRTFLILAVLLITISFGDDISEMVLKLATRDNPSMEASDYDRLMSGRTEAWDVGLNSFSDNPLLGIGTGNEQTLLMVHISEFKLHEGNNLHSSYISCLVEYGLLGTALLGLAVVIALRNGLAIMRRPEMSRGSSWLRAALPLSILVGALAHASSETWLLNPGNANCLLFWVLITYNIAGRNRRRSDRLSSKVVSV